MLDQHHPDPTVSAENPQHIARAYAAMQSLKRPERIGPYRILETLGEGGMGVVYLAEQEKPLHRRVALKVIKLGMDTKGVVARFEAERETLALMNHPHVAKIFDAGATEDGRPFFVMEYVPGQIITRYCDEKKLSTERRLQLFSDVCAAVQHAHQKGIIHRDIKPSNVLVSEVDGKAVVKVIDFGIAKATQQSLTEETFVTATGNFVGTPAYMSPEQAGVALGGAADIDTRTDVYSLGVLLYELLIGVLPFEPGMLRVAAFTEMQRIIREVDPPKPSTRLNALRAVGSATADQSEPPAQARGLGVRQGNADDTSRATIGKPPLPHGRGSDRRGIDYLMTIAEQRGTSVTSLLKQLRGDLDWVVMKCLEKDRTRRYEAVNALVMEIQRYLNYEPVVAGPPSAAYRLKKFVRRNRHTVMSLVAVFTVLIAGLIGTSYGLAQAVKARTAETEQRQIAEERSTQTERVARFQEAQWKQIDVPIMASRLRMMLIERLANAPVTAANTANGSLGAAQLVEALRAIDFTGLLLDTFDNNIFEHTLRAIATEFKMDPLIRARLLHVTATTLHDLTLYQRAEKAQQEALEIRRLWLGNSHPETLASVHGMGRLLLTQGKPEEAEPFLREALEQRRIVLGNNHPDTLESICFMGVLLPWWGKFADAEVLLREAVEGRQAVLGEEHPETLTTMEFLAFDLKAQEKIAESEVWIRKVLGGRQRVLGAKHHDTYSALSSLGGILEIQERWIEAESCFREALEGHRETLGDDHHTTLNSMVKLGGVLAEQGKLSEAEAVFRKACDSLRRILGLQHPETRLAFYNLATLLGELRKFSESELYYLEAVEAFQRFQGKGHPFTITSMQGITSLYESWHAVEPDKGYDDKAAEWRAKLDEFTRAEEIRSEKANDSSEPIP